MAATSKPLSDVQSNDVARPNTSVYPYGAYVVDPRGSGSEKAAAAKHALATARKADATAMSGQNRVRLIFGA